MSWQHSLVLFGAAFLAGAVNAVAGGGTLLTFPALLWVGRSNPALAWGASAEKIANATSTVALWPGQVSSLFGYRKEIGESRTAITYMAVPSFFGGMLGAYLLQHTPARTFAHIVPYLILTATCLFMAQEPLARWQRSRRPAASSEASESGITALVSPSVGFSAWLGIITFQFFVSIYGGYFGAGIGILMLAALGLMGFTNIHQMNALKNINALIINGIASAIFVFNGLVNWRIAAWMAVGSIFGGYAGAGTARKLGQKNVRRVVIGIGFVITLSLLIPH